MQGFNSQTKASDFKTRDIKVLRKLMPYLLKMRTRVILATLFLIVAKLANVAVPVALKGIVDALDQPDVLVVLPLGLLFAYGMLRLSSSLFNELRDAVFARVRYHAMCQVSPRCSLSPKITLRNISGSLINKSGFKLYQYSKAS